MSTTTLPGTEREIAAGAAISLRGLRKHFGPVRAVDGVDLTVAPGEVLALLGPNGAGKSTTVDLILGLTRPDAGEVHVFGRRPDQAVRDGVIGAMLQGGALIEDATVGEVVGMVAALHRRPQAAATALAEAGVADLVKRRCKKLSGGQRQRVRFAIALVSDPDLLILDEPTAAMDVETRRHFWHNIRALTATGKTVLFATHYLEEAESYADRVVLMRAGAVVADGTVAQIRATAAGRTLRAVLPGSDHGSLVLLPGVTHADLRGEHATIASTDSDATLRALLNHYPGARDIEITTVGLEDAFLALTSQEDK
ncbi:ABC transporter ATP-binding protein [Crossiella cryophila]|uniref:ABC-2 type transport system ATP-binding protein n=1 Tax=Crossiella cryophila TaxID=43355 RepID=A0A7W7C8G4_9PSEU|nr:ABC transporter ATP-binding protein [Crossiella cryophila]MBB4676435.1 ABC-2 type transport system ATP-binding protein [Crossiella cryophila]